MIEKYTILTCPQCEKRGYIQVYYDPTSPVNFTCVACGWVGHTPIDFTYRRDKVININIAASTVETIVRDVYHNQSYSWENEKDQSYSVTKSIDTGKFSAIFRSTGIVDNLNNEDILNILCQDGWLEPGMYQVIE
jgi:Zn ribbon nucleic-acid-binding protein